VKEMNENPITTLPIPALLDPWRSWRLGGFLPLSVTLASASGCTMTPVLPWEYVEYGFAADDLESKVSLFHTGSPVSGKTDRTAIDGRSFPSFPISLASSASQIVEFSAPTTFAYQKKVLLVEGGVGVKVLDASSAMIYPGTGNLCGSGAGQQPFWAPYRSAPDEFGGFVYVLHTGGCQPGAEIAISILQQSGNSLTLQSSDPYDAVSPGKIIVPPGVGNIPIDLRARAIFQAETTGVKYALKLGGTPAKVLQRFLYVTAAGPDTAIEHHPAPCQSGGCQVVAADKAGVESGGGPIPPQCIVVSQPLGFHTYDLNPCILNGSGGCDPNPTYKQAIRRVFLDDAIFEAGHSSAVCELGLDVALTEGFAYVVAPASGKLLKFNEADLQNGDPNFVVAPVSTITLPAGSFPADAVVLKEKSLQERRVYVALLGTDQVTYAKVSDDSLLPSPVLIPDVNGAAPTPKTPRSIAARGDGTTVFTANQVAGSVGKFPASNLTSGAKSTAVGTNVPKISIQAHPDAGGVVGKFVADLTLANSSSFDLAAHGTALVGQATGLLFVIDGATASPASVDAQAHNLIRNVTTWVTDPDLAASSIRLLTDAASLYRSEQTSTQ